MSLNAEPSAPVDPAAVMMNAAVGNGVPTKRAREEDPVENGPVEIKKSKTPSDLDILDSVTVAKLEAVRLRLITKWQEKRDQDKAFVDELTAGMKKVNGVLVDNDLPQFVNTLTDKAEALRIGKSKEIDAIIIATLNELAPLPDPELIAAARIRDSKRDILKRANMTVQQILAMGPTESSNYVFSGILLTHEGADAGERITETLGNRSAVKELQTTAVSDEQLFSRYGEQTATRIVVERYLYAIQGQRPEVADFVEMAKQTSIVLRSMAFDIDWLGQRIANT